ncbi:MAG: HAD hydrolase-like protein, partial [Bacteroidales bacterium]
MINSIIFDMDGVLIDSEPLYKLANYAHFRELGITVPDELYQTFIGIAGKKMWQILKQKYNLPLDGFAVCYPCLRSFLPMP